MGTLCFCGDTFLRSASGRNPLRHMLPVLGFTPTFLNLETSLASPGRTARKHVVLQMPEERLDSLPDCVRFVNIVNNHCSDSAHAGELARALRRRGKTVLGPENPARVAVRVAGFDVSFVAAYLRLPRLRLAYGGAVVRRMEELLQSAAGQRKIVSLHWGYEHTAVPAPFQRRLARRLAALGADLVIGHHPHVAQGWEVHRGTPIFYSLGNFNFWQLRARTAQKHRLGYVVAYELEQRDFRVIPYRIDDDFCPAPLPEADEQRARDRLADRCRELGIGCGQWFRRHYATWHAHEKDVYRARIGAERCPALALKFALWLMLPMQLRYYLSALRGR